MQRNESWVLIVVIGAFAAGLLAGGYRGEGDWQLGWNMFSALGTTLSAFAALWLSTHESRIYRRSRLIKAKVNASRLTIPLVEMADVAARFVKWSLMAEQEYLLRTPDAFSYWADQIQEASNKITDEDIFELEKIDGFDLDEFLACRELIFNTVLLFKEKGQPKTEKEELFLLNFARENLAAAEQLLHKFASICMRARPKLWTSYWLPGDTAHMRKKPGE